MGKKSAYESLLSALNQDLGLEPLKKRRKKPRRKTPLRRTHNKKIRKRSGLGPVDANLIKSLPEDSDTENSLMFCNRCSGSHKVCAEWEQNPTAMFKDHFVTNVKGKKVRKQAIHFSDKVFSWLGLKEKHILSIELVDRNKKTQQPLDEPYLLLQCVVKDFECPTQINREGLYEVRLQNQRGVTVKKNGVSCKVGIIGNRGSKYPMVFFAGMRKMANRFPELRRLHNKIGRVYRVRDDENVFMIRLQDIKKIPKNEVEKMTRRGGLIPDDNHPITGDKCCLPGATRRKSKSSSK